MDQGGGGGYRRSWIFREAEVAPGVFSVRQYRELIAVGDVVYFAREIPAPVSRGRTEAVRGWGLVVERRHEGWIAPSSEAQAKDPQEGVEENVGVVVDSIVPIEPPLHYEQLLRLPGLRGLTFLRNPTGTNFRVTATEAALLNGLIREQNGSSPPDPEGTDSGEFPSDVLSDYRFSGTPTRILATALQLLASSREDRLESPDLFTLCLELAGTYTDRTGISKYLRGVLGDEPLEYVAGLRQLTGIEAVRNQTGALPWLETGSFAVRGVNVAAGVLRAVDRARQLAIATTEREQIRFRHLVAALLIDDDPATQKRIEASGFEPGPLRADFLASVLEQFDDDEKAWRLVLGAPTRSAPQAAFVAPAEGLALETAGALPEKGAEPAGGPSPGAPPPGAAPAPTPATAGEILAELLVPFIADRPEGRDLLGLEEEYRAFGKLIAGRDTKLPMAIGLFGHWGTGKSFFMGKLREEIAGLAGSDVPQYCHDVAQIEFNAWHYMEADIWASFADHIFRELESKTRENEDAEQRAEEQERFENLLDQLETWSALKESSSRKLDLARERTKKAREKVDHANRRAARAGSLVDARREQLLRELKDGTLFTRLEQVFGAARSAFGLEALEAAEEAAKGANETLAEARDVLAETEGLEAQVTELARRFDLGRAARDRLLPLVAWTAAAVSIGLLLSRYGNAIAGAAGTLTEVLGAAGLAVGWMRARTARAAAFVQELKAVRDDFEAKAQEAFTKKKSPELARAQLKLERVSSELDGAEQEHAVATSRVSDLEAQLASSTPAERIVQFIRERASSEAYRGRLGTLALVRRDFERLSSLLEQQARGVRMTDRTGKPIRLPELDRVVLYIDDLDRIPWEKVVKVLQAVHLLLAFPLFVVVVAVDARWVRESVEHHLRSLSRDRESEQDQDFAGDRHSAPMRPGEFLEKIIQVPFWLRPLTEQTTTALIDGLIEENEKGRARASTGALATERTPAPTAAGADDSPDDLRSEQPDDAGTPASSPAAPPAGGAAEDADDGGDGTATDLAITTPDDDGAARREGGGESVGAAAGGGTAGSGPRDPAPLGVPDIREPELAFMKALAPIVGRTPRVVKRFVNLYLILRAFRPETGSEDFVAEDGAYRAALLLLAVLTGQAADATNVFGWFESGAVVDTLGEWVRGESTPQVVLAGESEHVHKLLLTLVGQGHDDIRMEHVNAWMLYVSRFGFERPFALA